MSEKCGIESDTMVDILSNHAMNSALLQLSMKNMFSGVHDPLFMLQVTIMWGSREKEGGVKLFGSEMRERVIE